MSEQEGTITRCRSFAQVPDDLITDKRLSSHSVRVWCRLDKYAGKNGQAFPSRAALANDLGLSLDIIKRALAQLAQTGWIKRTRRPGTNVWDTELIDAPGRSTRRSSKAKHGAPVHRPRRTSAPTHGAPVRHQEGEPRKDTQQRTPPPAPPAAQDVVVVADAEGEGQKTNPATLAEAVLHNVGDLRTSITRSVLDRECARLAGIGWTTDALTDATADHEWEDARPGAVIAWLRGLDRPSAAPGKRARRCRYDDTQWQRDKLRAADPPLTDEELAAQFGLELTAA